MGGLSLTFHSDQIPTIPTILLRSAWNAWGRVKYSLDQIQLLYDLDEELNLDPDKKESNKLIHDKCVFNQIAFIFDRSKF